MVVAGTLAGGGAERFVSTILEQLDRRRFSISLCLLRRQIQFALPADVAVFDLDHRAGLRLPRTWKRLRSVLNEQRPDVILNNLDATAPYVGEALADCETRPAWIARTSNSPKHTFRAVRGALRKMWLKRVYPRADYFVANSVGVARQFAEVFPFSTSRLRTIGNPVDIKKLKRLAQEHSVKESDPRESTLIWMGRFCAQKRLDVLIEALRQVSSVRRTRLYLCGEGPLERQIRKCVDRFGLTEVVEFVPFQPNPFPILATADLALSTSDYEGLSNSVLEAQALGVPVIATRCDFGNEEIIRDGETGILTDRGDAKAIAEGALKLLACARSRREMSLAATANIHSRYDVSHTIPLWEDLLTEAASSRGHGHTRLVA